MGPSDDFEDIRGEAEEILDYSGFHRSALGGYGGYGRFWEIEDDDSHLDEDGGPYGMWLDLEPRRHRGRHQRPVRGLHERG